MKTKPSKPFSSGTEYECFRYEYCERCKKYVEREEDGFPEFPENGGCRILDLMERARMEIDFFPSDLIIEVYDDDGELKRFHHCVEFEEKT